MYINVISVPQLQSVERSLDSGDSSNGQGAQGNQNNLKGSDIRELSAAILQGSESSKCMLS